MREGLGPNLEQHAGLPNPIIASNPFRPTSPFIPKMVRNQYKIRAKVWIYPGVSAAWHLVTVPKKLSAKIKAHFGVVHRGWSSLPVRVTVGRTTWRTSMFFEKKRGAYILPLKAEVRKKEKISAGATTALSFQILP